MDRSKQNWIQTDLDSLAMGIARSLEEIWEATPDAHPRKSLFSSLDDYVASVRDWQQQDLDDTKDAAQGSFLVY